MEKELSCEFSRINPDEKIFNTFKAKNEIFRHIKESIKNQLKSQLKNL